MKSKKVVIIVAVIILLIAIGSQSTRSSANAYSEDYNKISEISTTSLAISDAYSNASGKRNFKKEANKVVRDLGKTKMKTKEGKDVLKAYVEISESLVDTIVDSWNKGVLQGTGDKKIIELEANLKDKMNKFDEKIEELKIESGFYDGLEQLK